MMERYNRLSRRSRSHVLLAAGLFTLVSLSILSSPKGFVSILLPSSWLEVVDPIVPTQTRYMGGIPGYTVFDNIWFHDGAFRFFTDEPLEFDTDIVTTGRSKPITHTMAELDEVIQSRSTQRIKGETIWINTGYGGGGVPNLVSWYYHFATELVMGPTSVLAAIRTSEAEVEGKGGSEGGSSVNNKMGIKNGDKLADHLIIPGVDWKDRYGLNEYLVQGTFMREAELVDRPTWARMTNGEKDWVLFDRVVITDRGATTSDPIVQEWNKMALHAFTLPRPHSVFEPFRKSMASHLHKSTPSRKEPGKALSKIPKIVYIDRQDTSRHLIQDDHDELLKFLRGMEREKRISFVHGEFGKMGLRQQVESVLDADIIIGVHGNGLTHQLFMSSGGVIIEFFLPETFLRDYQVVAEALSHTHYAVRNDTTYPRSEWKLHPGEQNASRLHDGTGFPLDPTYIQGLLNKVVDEMTW